MQHAERHNHNESKKCLFATVANWIGFDIFAVSLLIIALLKYLLKEGFVSKEFSLLLILAFLIRLPLKLIYLLFKFIKSKI